MVSPLAEVAELSVPQFAPMSQFSVQTMPPPEVSLVVIAESGTVRPISSPVGGGVVIASMSCGAGLELLPQAARKMAAIAAIRESDKFLRFIARLPSSCLFWRSRWLDSSKRGPIRAYCES